MIIRKLRLFLEDIEAYVNCWGQSIVGDLENCGQADAEHIGRLLYVSLKKLAAEKA